MKTGAIILAGGDSDSAKEFAPMKNVGAISAVQRIVLNFKQADVDLIVLVLGANETQLEEHIAHMGVICLRNEKLHGQMLDSIKTGLCYLQGKCENILITPTDIPLFTLDTVVRLIDSGEKLAIPACNGKPGHPLLLHADYIPEVLAFEGDGGLRRVIQQTGHRPAVMEVEDEGILVDIEETDNYQSILDKHNLQGLRPEMRVRLSKEKPFWGPGTLQLLTLIQNGGSVRLACQQMGISYSKAWKMIGLMEDQLGFAMVARQQGGKSGGSAYLTDEAKQLIECYIAFEKDCKRSMKKIFEKHFGETNF